MKIIHTSDWHVGHQLYGYDRTEEFRDMFRQLEELIAHEKPDLLLVSGDIFDVANPPAAVQKLLVGALMGFLEVNPGMKIVITAGNHDSGIRHEIFRSPWKKLGIETIGTLHLENPEQHIVEIPGKGFVVAIPYANERYMPENFVRDLLASLKERNHLGLPVVVAPHTTVRGADFKGHEKTGDYTVGGIDGVEIEKFGTDYDYLALGHIHHPQFVHTGKHNARYSGSPVAISFDEDFNHSVTVVTAGGQQQAPETSIREILPLRPLVNLPATGSVDWERALRLLEGYPPENEAYIRLNVSVKDFLPPGAFETALSAVKDKKCRFCLINHHREPGENDLAEKKFTVNEFKELDPLEVARMYVEESGGRFDDELREMFLQAVNEIK